MITLQSVNHNTEKRKRQGKLWRYLGYWGLILGIISSIYALYIPIRKKIFPSKPRLETVVIDTINHVYVETNNSQFKNYITPTGVLVHPNKDTLREYSSDDDTSSNSLIVRTLKFHSVSSANTTNDAEVVQLNEPSSPKGFGKLSVRVNCSYCNRGGDIHVYDSNYQEIAARGISTNYDSLNIRATTFSKDLPPGRYKYVLNFGDQGSDTVDTHIFENEVSLFYLNKNNPFGEGNGEVVFESFDGTVKNVEIFIDGISRGKAKLTKKRMYAINLQEGHHQYVIKNLQPDPLSDLESKPTVFEVNVGAKYMIAIR